MSEFAERILSLLTDHPGSKATDIARALGIDRRQVNSALYGELRGQVEQDSEYRWRLKGTASSSRRGPAERKHADTQLARLCAYYLDCIGAEGTGGVSVFASSQWPDYSELSSNPVVSDSDALRDSEAREILAKTRTKDGPLSHYIGFPVHAKRIRSKRGWEGFILEPLFLVPVIDGAIEEGYPQLNLKAVESLAGSESSTLIEDALALMAELGLDHPQPEMPEVDELLARLQEVRAHWPWIEAPDPYSLPDQPSLDDVDEPGIYNRTVVLATLRSTYTRGLEAELANLRDLAETDYSNTALGRWLTRIPESGSTDSEPLLEPLPLNSEQRAAVERALSKQLTVITGPPGTGKSQVVSSILINAAWRGMTTLFVSKNNKAVDVVEERVNALGSRPVLLRLGRGEFQSKLSTFLTALLSATVTDGDRQRYSESEQTHRELELKKRDLETALSEFVGARNFLDDLDKDAEEARRVFGDGRSAAEIDVERISDSLSQIDSALKRADRSQRGAFTSLFWFLYRKSRWEQVRSAVEDAKGDLSLLDVETLPDFDEDTARWRGWLEDCRTCRDLLVQLQRYEGAKRRLLEMPTLESVAEESSRLSVATAEVSEDLWRGWLKLQPSRLTSEMRKLLGDYAAVLELRAKADEQGQMVGREAFRKYQELFPKVVQALPCWAITSLSVRNRVPLQAAFFDLLVVDEASQCDIGSLIPLLFRARRVAVIGDPMQLRHVSTLSQSQDRQLLVKHELMDYIGWSYSSRSAFDLASALCSSDDIVDLRDHHRSHAEIVQFSNEHFYENRLRVVTKYSNLRRPEPDGPAVRWVDVVGRVDRPPNGGAVNPVEAEAVVTELRRLVLEQEYLGSIGVVSPFRAHANRISDIVGRDRQLSRELAARDFIADTVHRFQGDERDLMIFSPVVSTGAHQGAFLFLRNNPNLFNVAVTRARAALVVVGDRQTAHKSGVDYLARFSEYVVELGREGRTARSSEIQTDLGPHFPPHLRSNQVSPWEEKLYEALYGAGMAIVPQLPVESYLLDLALIQGSRRLDIEVDGERYHRRWDGELTRRDQLRTQRLLELGWDVMRFWVYEVRDDLDACVERVASWRDSAQS